MADEETILRMSRKDRKRYEKGERPSDAMQRLILAITYAIDDDLSLTNVTDIINAMLIKLDGDIQKAIELVESKTLTFENLGPMPGFRYMTFEELSRQTGCSIEEANEHLDDLEDKGFVVISKRDEHGFMFKAGIGLEELYAESIELVGSTH